jgi:hypothetical protein
MWEKELELLFSMIHDTFKLKLKLKLTKLTVINKSKLASASASGLLEQGHVHVR